MKENNQVRSGDVRHTDNDMLEVVEINIRPVKLMLAGLNRHDESVPPHGLRFNNPDPFEPQPECQRLDNLGSDSRENGTRGRWPCNQAIASGCATKEFENATKRFFSVISEMERLQRAADIRRWADVPKTLCNITAVAKYLYLKPSINRLFDSVLDVQAVVESCWNSL